MQRAIFGWPALRHLAALLGLCLLGCGPDFDPPSELHSLRILGVQKDAPYAQPGQTVNLQMLWTDASPKRPRPVQIAWSPPCFDPPGDLYYACFGDSGVFGADGMLVLDRDSTSVRISKYIINGADPNIPGGNDGIAVRPPPPDARNAPYGIAFVFFAVCAGEFTVVPRSDETTFPIGCKDENGTLLGSDDFVAGYTSIYSFKSFSNNNPVVTGFTFNGRDFTTADNPGPASGEAGAANADSASICLNETCTSGSRAQTEFDFDCTAYPERCVPTCADDGDSSCHGYSLNPMIDKNDPKNQDQDDVSAQLLGRQVGEQMWINYYAEAGGFKSPVRLLNDATTGWNDDFATEFYAPKAPGPFRVWALAHDNRGGVAWSGITLKAE
jgi:hypothetical protein